MTRIAWSQLYTLPGMSSFAAQVNSQAASRYYTVAQSSSGSTIPIDADDHVGQKANDPTSQRFDDPSFVVMRVDRELARARETVKQGEWKDAGKIYEGVLNDIGRPSDVHESQSARIIRQSPGGDALLHTIQRHVLMEYASYTVPSDRFKIEHDLSVIRGDIQSRTRAITKRLERIEEEVGADRPDAAQMKQRLERLAKEYAQYDERMAPLQLERDGVDQARLAAKAALDEHDRKIDEVRSNIDCLECLRDDAKAERTALGIHMRGQMRKDNAWEMSFWEEKLKPLNDSYKDLAREREPLFDELSDLEERLESLDESLDALHDEREAIRHEEQLLEGTLAGGAYWVDEMTSFRDAERETLLMVRLVEGSLAMRYSAGADEVAEEVADLAGREVLPSSVQRIEDYRYAERAGRDVLAACDPLDEASDESHIKLLAHTLVLEALARQAERAMRCGELSALEAVLPRLDESVRQITFTYEDAIDERRSLVVGILADVIIVLSRMGLMDRALTYFHRMGTSESYRHTEAFKELMKTEPFSLYRDRLAQEVERFQRIAGKLKEHRDDLPAGGDLKESEAYTAKWARILDERQPSEEFFGAGSLGHRFWQRVRATIKGAHYARPIRERLVVGGSFSAYALYLDYLSTGGISILGPALTGTLSNTAIRFGHGWSSPQARSAWKTGIYANKFNEKPKDVAADVLKDVTHVGARSLAGLAFWAIVPSLLSTGMANVDKIAATVGNIGHAWNAGIGLAGSGLNIEGISLFLDAHRIIRQSGYKGTHAGFAQFVAGMYGDENALGLFRMMPSLSANFIKYGRWYAAEFAVMASLVTRSWAPLEHLYYAYMGSAAAVYGAYAIMPHLRTELEKLARFFVPGAVALGAHLNIAISGNAEWTAKHGAKMILSGIALLEGIAMLFGTGTIPLARRNQDGSTKPLLSSLGKGIWRDANHMGMVAVAITVGVSGAIGELILGGKEKLEIDSIGLAAILGTMTTAGLLPMTLAISGILKQQIPVIARGQENWHDTQGMKLRQRLWELALAGGAAVRAPYIKNRTMRVPTYDAIASIPRVFIGWNNPLGYIPFMIINTIAWNTASSWSYSETAGTPWQHDAFRKAAFKGIHMDQDKIMDTFQKVQRMSPLHWLFYAGNQTGESLTALKDWWRWKFGGDAGAEPATFPDGLKASLYPLASIQKIPNPPDYPLTTDRHYLAEFYLYVTGQTDEADASRRISHAQLETLLDEISCVASNPQYRDVLRPIIMVLYLGRSPEQAAGDAGSGRHRKIIRRWFDRNPWLVRMMYIDTDALHPVEARTRRLQRARVRKLINESIEEYERRVNAYINVAKRDLTYGLLK